MPKQLEDILLHKVTKHTNLHIPFSLYISGNKFPEQNKDLLGKLVDLRYRDMYIYTKAEPDITHGPESYESLYTYTGKFKIVRCDNFKPYTMIGISTDYTLILVTDSRYYREYIAQYPIQIDSLIGLGVYDQYPGVIPELRGVTLRVDNGEPCYSVIAEFVGDNQVRLLLGDECMTKLVEHYNDKVVETYYGIETRNNVIKLRREIFERFDLYYGDNSNL